MLSGSAWASVVRGPWRRAPRVRVAVLVVVDGLVAADVQERGRVGVVDRLGREGGDVVAVEEARVGVVHELRQVDEAEEEQPEHDVELDHRAREAEERLEARAEAREAMVELNSDLSTVLPDVGELKPVHFGLLFGMTITFLLAIYQVTTCCYEHRGLEDRVPQWEVDSNAFVQRRTFYKPSIILQRGLGRPAPLPTDDYDIDTLTSL